MESIVEYYLNQGYRITSPYGWRIHPTYKDLRFHYGTDLGGKVRGTPIHFPYYGKIRHITYHSIYGNLIMVESARMQVLFMFAHCHDIRVSVGQSVIPGQVVGTVGATGNATGPHIHLEIRSDDGTKMGGKVWGDPEDYFEGDGFMHHKVKAGETAARIAAQYGITLEELAAANPQVADLNKIYLDQILAIPQKVVRSEEVPGTRAPYEYEVSGFQWLVDKKLINSPDAHKATDMVTKGFLGQMLKRLKFETKATTKIS